MSQDIAALRRVRRWNVELLPDVFFLKTNLIEQVVHCPQICPRHLSRVGSNLHRT